jgi:hypothetical protein
MLLAALVAMSGAALPGCVSGGRGSGKGGGGGGHRAKAPERIVGSGGGARERGPRRGRPARKAPLVERTACAEEASCAR